MPQYRVSLSFAQLPDVALDDFAGAIIVGLTGNVGYPAPPVTVAQLGTLKQTLQDAVAAQAQGGTTATAAKNTARNALVEGLRKDANYVEIACNNDLPTLLGSGFQSASTNRAPSVLDKVQIVGVDNGQTGELKVRIDPIANAKGFDGRNPGSVSTSRRFHSRTRNRSCSKASLRGSPTRCNCVPSVAAPVQAIGAIQYRTWRCNCEGAQPLRQRSGSFAIRPLVHPGGRICFAAQLY